MTLTPVFIIGIISYGLYKVFELLIRRRERIMLIEKLESIKDSNIKIPDLNFLNEPKNFMSIRVGCILAGLGLGLFLGMLYILKSGIGDWMIKNTLIAASVMLFGGLGMIISFIIERKILKKSKDG